MDMEGVLEEDMYVFKLAELHTTYESSLKTLNITSSISRTRLKRELMKHFQEHEMQEQSDGKHVIFVWMHSLLRNISLPCQINSETLQLARVAKIICSEVEKAFEFVNKFPPNGQTDCVPCSLNLLVSMELYGPNLKNDVRYNDSPSCLTISQLVIFNSMKTQCSSPILPLGTRLFESLLFPCTLA